MTAPGTPDPREARFTDVAATVYEPLQRYAARRVDHGEVPDVVSETLLVLWRRLDEVPADAVLPWAYGVARHCIANQRRSAVRRHRLWERAASDAVSAGLLAGDTDRAPSEDALDDDVGAALDELGERDRELVLLWAWEGLQPREIAVVLGTSANAVSLRLSRARRRLRARLRHRQRAAGGRAGHLTPVSEDVAVSEESDR